MKYAVVHRDAFIISLLAGILSAMLISVFLAIVNREMLAGDYILVFLLILTAAIFGSYVAISRIKLKAYELGLKEKSNQILQSMGLVDIYTSIDSAMPEIVQEISTSRTQYYFLQLGRTIFSGGTNIYDLIFRDKNEGVERDIKILHASRGSPYLSKVMALQRGGDFSEWMIELSQVHAKAKVFSGSGVECREHNEGFVWRLFIFDKVLFCQPYYYESGNGRMSPVYKFERQFLGDPNPHSIYRAFRKFFELKWEENIPHLNKLEDFIDPKSPTSVAAVLKYGEYSVWAVPKRYLEANSNAVPFHGVGGKLAPGEAPITGLQREASEEVGVNVKIIGAAKTKYGTTGANLGSIEIDSDRSPFVIHKRIRSRDFSMIDETLLLIGYYAEIPADYDLKPKSEIGALIILSEKMLSRSFVESLTFADVMHAVDGSRIISECDYDHLKNRTLYPSGLAPLYFEELNNQRGAS
ncbi:MAG: NUDIX domain-containing protein [Oceanicaulis sp.]|nr:NUDIX domain-containing protein [Oceanicaulis sp.]